MKTPHGSFSLTLPCVVLVKVPPLGGGTLDNRVRQWALGQFGIWSEMLERLNCNDLEPYASVILTLPRTCVIAVNIPTCYYAVGGNSQYWAFTGRKYAFGDIVSYCSQLKSFIVP